MYSISFQDDISIENPEGFVVFGGGFQQVAQRSNKGVDAAAGR